MLEVERVGLTDNFFELGGDSLAAEEVILQVEARLGVSIDIRDLGFGTLQQVAAACDEHLGSAHAAERRRLAPLRWARSAVQRMRSGG